ncbi:uncharacterized protein LOC142621148 [Castanea sativa]|uniref:uncharacterized protein LOC142621148 n=1 Tax=Castanea sativa TaxID=21020 RepID=UPI003F650C6E
MVGMFQGIKPAGLYSGSKPIVTFNIVIPGSEIPRWFRHRSAGVKGNALVAHPSHSCNKWIGMAMCAGFSPGYLHVDLSKPIFASGRISFNEGSENDSYFGFLTHKFVQMESDHLWLLYIHPECPALCDMGKLSQIDETGFIHISCNFSFNEPIEVKKCGFRMVYEPDIEELREMMAQSSNSSCIVPYEGSRSHAIPIPRYHPYKDVDVDAQRDFDNSTEGSKIEKSRDEYDGAGPSGDGSSYDVPRSRRIQLYRKDVWLMVAPTMVILVADILFKVVENYSNDVPQSRRIQLYTEDEWLMVDLTMITMVSTFVIMVLQNYFYWTAFA